MNQNMVAYVFAFSAVLTFSLSAVGFTYFSQKVSALWMNVFKCSVSLLFCLPVIFYLHGQFFWSPVQYWPFYLSGFIGLNVGDWLLLSAFKRMGPGRTLILFGFQPLITGSFAWWVWGETLFPMQFIAIFFFLLCLFLFSYERFKKLGHWEIGGLFLALGGVALDSAGILLTRYGFNENPALTGLEVHYLRSLSALLSFAIYLPFIKINFIGGLKKLTMKERGVAFTAGFFGTFLSLVFYMQAVKLGKLATVSSIVLTDPAMSTFFESLWLRKWPSRYLWAALISFACAMFFLFYPQLS